MVDVRIVSRIAALLLLLFILASCSKRTPGEGSTLDLPSNKDQVLLDYSDESLARLEKFIKRFNTGKPDRLIMILPAIDGGPWVNDLTTLGGTDILYRQDWSRDAYSGLVDGRTDRTYSCRGLTKVEEPAAEPNGVWESIRLTDCVDKDETQVTQPIDQIAIWSRLVAR